MRYGRAPRAFLAHAAIVAALGLVVACQLDPGSVGGPPTLAGTTTDGTGGSDDPGSSDAADSTGQPNIEGPRRRRLDLDPTLVDGVGGTTILVKLDASRIEYGLMADDGSDLRFFGPEPLQAFPIEIERWDPDGVSYVWVRVALPTLPDHIWMYYAQGESYTAVAPEEVWDGAFSAVWHMALGGNARITDTTVNGHDLQPIGLPEGFEVDGLIGTAAALPAPDPMLAAGPLELLDSGALAMTDGFTLEAWVAPSQTNIERVAYVLRKGTSWELHALEPMLTRPRLVVRTTDGSGPYIVEAGASLVAEQWTYVAATYRAEDGTLEIYRDGAVEGSIVVTAAPGGRTLADTDKAVQLGRGFEGLVDEVRVSAIARSPAWIRLQHASMADALLTFNPPEAQP